jgi:hypothetical protein
MLSFFCSPRIQRPLSDTQQLIAAGKPAVKPEVSKRQSETLETCRFPTRQKTKPVF